MRKKVVFYIFFLYCNISLAQDYSKIISNILDSSWIVKKTNLKRALELCNEALLIARENGLKSEEARCLGNIGVILENFGEYDKALYYHFQALRISDSLKNNKFISIVYNNIGNCYYYLKKFDNAVDYYSRSLEIKQKENDLQGVANSYNNLGLCYFEQRDFTKAKKYFADALSLNKKLKNQFGQAIQYNNIGKIYYSLNNIDSARIYFERSLNIFSDLNDNLQKATLLKNLSNVYIKNNNLNKAFEYAIKAQKIAEQLENIEILIEVYTSLKNIYQKKGKYEEAMNYLDKIIDLLKKQDFTERAKISATSEALYNIESKQKQIELLKQENEINRLKSEKFRWSFLLTLNLAMLIIIILFVFYQRRLFKIQRKEFEMEYKLLRSQINSHFIFNVINSIQSCILNEDKITAYNYNAKFAKLIRTILEHSREKTISLSEEIEALKNYLELEKFRMENKFEYTIIVEENIDVINQKIPAMLVQPFVENAIWHGLSNINYPGLIKIIFKKNEEFLTIIIEDNGRGINTELKKEHKHKSLGVELTLERLILLNRSRKRDNLKIEDLADENGNHGTRVTMKLLLKNIEKLNKK